MTLHIDLQAIVANWTALAAKAPGARAGAVVKADAYGLGAARVAPALYEAGARDFFVALASEGRALRRHLPDDARIYVLSGHMEGADLRGLIPVRDAVRSVLRAQEANEPWGTLQTRLRVAYNSFVRQFGPINHTTVSHRNSPIGMSVFVTKPRVDV